MRSWKWQGVNHVFLCDCDRLVSGAGDIKLTKDGNVLLHEMVNYLADYSFVVKVFIEIDKMYWLFAGSISRILWCLEPICPATVNCRFILTSFYKETTTFSLQDMFRHSYVIFSCKCDFNGCTFEFIWNYVTNYIILFTLQFTPVFIFLQGSCAKKQPFFSEGKKTLQK